MILYVNGDSNSAGTELTNIEYSWPVVLAKKLTMTLVNNSRPGSSNDRIIRTVSTAPKSDVFVVIGWTSWEREEWCLNQQYYNVNASGYDSMPEELESKYKHWVTEQNDYTRCIKSRRTHNQIYQLHQSYQQQKIPHLFFNALMGFSFDTPQVDWHNNYFYPYSNDYSYYWHLNAQGYQTTEKFHHNESAQQYWADLIYKYIQDNQLI